MIFSLCFPFFSFSCLAEFALCSWSHGRQGSEWKTESLYRFWGHLIYTRLVLRGRRRLTHTRPMRYAGTTFIFLTYLTNAEALASPLGYRTGKWGTGRLMTLPRRYAPLGRDRARIWTQAVWLLSHAAHTPLPHPPQGHNAVMPHDTKLLSPKPKESKRQLPR